MIIDTLLLFATAPGASGVTPNVASPGSLTLQPDNEPDLAFIATCFQSTAAFLRLSTPSGHDTTVGWRVGGGFTDQLAQIHARYMPKVTKGETISATIAGSSTAGDIELAALAVAYPKLPGEFVSAQEVRSRAEQFTTVRASTLTPTINGTWPAGSALNTLQDTLKPLRRYAVLGATIGSSANILGLMLTGPDTGFYRVLIPVADQRRGLVLSDTMYQLAAATGMPIIPTFNGGNVSQTLVGLVGNENATARSVDLILALLK